MLCYFLDPPAAQRLSSAAAMQEFGALGRNLNRITGNLQRSNPVRAMQALSQSPKNSMRRVAQEVSFLASVSVGCGREAGSLLSCWQGSREPAELPVQLA